MCGEPLGRSQPCGLRNADTGCISAWMMEVKRGSASWGRGMVAIPGGGVCRVPSKMADACGRTRDRGADVTSLSLNGTNPWQSMVGSRRRSVPSRRSRPGPNAQVAPASNPTSPRPAGPASPMQPSHAAMPKGMQGRMTPRPLIATRNPPPFRGSSTQATPRRGWRARCAAESRHATPAIHPG